MKLYIRLCVRLNQLLGKLRVIHFRLLGIKIGRGCHIDRGVSIKGNVEIGAGSNIGAYTYIGTAYEGRVVIGENCHIGKLNQLGSSGTSLVIGDHCIFAPYVQVTDAIHEFRDRNLLIKEAPLLAAPVEIGANVWLGSGVMVMRGVSIGTGAVIGAQALVRESIPDNAIVVGTPSRIVGYRGDAPAR